MARIEIKTEEVRFEYTCDVCVAQGEGAPNQTCRKCKGCRCDTCCKHWNICYLDPFSGADLGDYPVSYCPTCFQALQTLVPEINALSDKFEEDMDKLREKFAAMIKSE